MNDPTELDRFSGGTEPTERHWLREPLKRIGDRFASITGSTVGVVVGVAATPLFDIPTALASIAGAALIGGTAGEFVKGSVETLADYLDRQLTPREARRATAAGLVALQGILRKLDEGEHPNPAFVASDGVDGSVGDAILEGVLRAAEEAHDQMKTLHLGYFHAEAAFDRELDAWTAHRLLDVARSLTFRQLAFLRAFSGEVDGLELRDGDYRGREFDVVSLSAAQEVLDLWQREIARRSDNTAMLGAEDVVPAGMRLTEFGCRITRLLRLDSIPDDDVIDACAALRA